MKHAAKRQKRHYRGYVDELRNAGKAIASTKIKKAYIVIKCLDCHKRHERSTCLHSHILKRELVSDDGDPALVGTCPKYDYPFFVRLHCNKCTAVHSFDDLMDMRTTIKEALGVLPQPIMEEVWNHIGFDPLL